MTLNKLAGGGFPHYNYNRRTTNSHSTQLHSIQLTSIQFTSRTLDSGNPSERGLAIHANLGQLDIRYQHSSSVKKVKQSGKLRRLRGNYTNVGTVTPDHGHFVHFGVCCSSIVVVRTDLKIFKKYVQKGKGKDLDLALLALA